MSSEIEDRRTIGKEIVASCWNNQNSIFPNFSNSQNRSLISAVKQKFESSLIDDVKYSSNIAPDQNFLLAGRIIFLRALGKIIFLRLRDESGEIQIQFSPQYLNNFKELEIQNHLNVGDFISADGAIIISKTGELTLAASSFQLLTKSFRPLPTKQGLSDQETLYRQRYLDFAIHPEKLNLLRLRSEVLKTLRSILDANNFVEVETPTLHHSVGGASARPFVTHHNFLDQDLTLRVAPELYLKRLLVGGLERVYEIGRCFRNESIDSKHNPEFTSLEFYWSYFSLNEMIEFVHNILSDLLEIKFNFSASFVLQSKPSTLSIQELANNWLQKYHQISIFQIHEMTDSNSIPLFLDQKVFTHFKSLSVEMRNFFLFETFVEEKLAEEYNCEGKSIPVFVTQFPLEVSPLAKPLENNPKLADRFELYINGMEIANAFQELNDPDLQASNFTSQINARKNPDAEYMDFDSDYIKALEYGMPPAVGCGIGIDRLVMLLAGQSSIKEVLAFPAMRK